MIYSLIAVACLAMLCTAPLAQPLPEPVRETFNCSADGSRWAFLTQNPEGTPEAILLNFYGHYSDHHQGMAVGSYNDAFGKLRRECLRRNWAYICPFYGGNSWMGPIAESGVADLIGLLRKRWPECPVYIEGGSMGGSSVLVFATVRPELVDGVIARCPAADIEAYYDFARASENGTLKNIADAIRIHYTADGHDLRTELRKRSALQNAEKLTMPVHIVHGSGDSTIPFAPTRALAERLEELGHPVQYIEIEGGNHDSPVNQEDWVDCLDFISSTPRAE